MIRQIASELLVEYSNEKYGRRYGKSFWRQARMLQRRPLNVKLVRCACAQPLCGAVPKRLCPV